MSTEELTCPRCGTTYRGDAIEALPVGDARREGDRVVVTLGCLCAPIPPVTRRWLQAIYPIERTLGPDFVLAQPADGLPSASLIAVRVVRAAAGRILLVYLDGECWVRFATGNPAGTKAYRLKGEELGIAQRLVRAQTSSGNDPTPGCPLDPDDLVCPGH